MFVAIELNVNKANAQNCYAVYGAPSPFAAIGFATALCEREGIAWNSNRGVAITYHSYRALGNYEYRGKSGRFCFDLFRSSLSERKTLLDTPRADFETTLIFEIYVDGEVGFGEKIQKRVNTMRYAGGVIVSSVISYANSFSEITKKIKPGVVLRQPVDGDMTEGSVDELIKRLSKQRDHPQRGKLAVSMIGLSLLSEPTKREGSRGGHLHAFADPIIGLVEYKTTKEIESSYCWRLVHSGEKDSRFIEFRTHQENQ